MKVHLLPTLSLAALFLARAHARLTGPENPALAAPPKELRMTTRKVFVLAILGALLARPCAASDPTPLITMVVGVPVFFLSVLALALASSAPRAGFFVSLVLLTFLGVSIGSWSGTLLYLSLAINAIALVVAVVKLAKREPGETSAASGKGPGRQS